MAWWEILLAIYIILTTILHMLFFFSVGGESLFLCKTPKEIYLSTKMNWFGSIMAWVFEVILLPGVWFTIMIAIAIYWITHVGRKGE
jgi:hypothetical protein